MKKFFLLAAVLFTLNSYAQDKLFKTASNAYILKQFENAKTEIDKAMANPQAQSKAEGWLWKTRIYAELYGDEALKTKYPDCGKTALESFKKYEELDGTYAQIAEASVSWRPLDLMYVTSFNEGRAFFEKKQWDLSYNTFMTTVYLGDVIVKKNLRKTNAPIDTISVLYAAYAAQNAKKTAEAVALYRKFADLKIGGDDYKDAYTYILVYAADAKDKNMFYKYLATAKELYPSADWDDYEADFITKNYTTAQKVEAYEKDDASGTMSARKYLLYGQVFTDISRDEKEAPDSLTKVNFERKATEAFVKAYNKDNTLGIAAYNAGIFYYNEFGIYDERQSNNRRALRQLNENKPVEKDPKKKAAADADFKKKTDAIKNENLALDKPVLENLDNAILWLEKGFDALQKGDVKDKTIKNCLNNTVKWLANCYQYKREKVKGKDVKAYDEYDAKYKKYDELYNKF